MSEEKENTIETLSLEDIIEEGEKIYPISEESDRKSMDIIKITNWIDIFYNKKQEKTKQRFNELVSKSEHSNFFEGLNYEYGINNKEQNIQKAFEIYKKSADNSIDTMSMYKLYHIYKNEYNKFNLGKRNRVYEKFYLYKCFAFLNYQQLKRNIFLCNRFDIVLEVVVQFEQEEATFEKLKDFLVYLKKYYKKLQLNLKDILVIESVFNFKFGNEVQNMKNAIQQLINLLPSNPNNINTQLDLEIFYKIACYLQEINDLGNAEKYFNYLINSKYYRAFPDFALFLYEKQDQPQKALVILRLAFENGNYCANNIYYNIFLNTFNFSKISKDVESIKNFMIIIINLLINNCVLDEVYSFFEFFYFRKILIKKYDFKSIFDEYDDYTKEFAQFLIKITSPEKSDGDPINNFLQNDDNIKELIMQYFQRKEFYAELNFACGIIYYYGIENALEKDYLKSLQKIRISYYSSISENYKRFCYSYIYKIRKKLNEQKVINPKNKSLIVSDKKLNKTKIKLFELFKASLEDIINLSSSVFYYLSRLLKKQIGNDGDLLLEYICAKRACECNNRNTIFGSVISYYRRYKAIDFLNNTDRYNQILEGIMGIKDSEGYGEDNSLCPICYTQVRNVACLPCKHLFCNNCIEKIMTKRKCPICRGAIIIIADIQTENDKK